MNRRLSAMNAEITDITYAFPKLEHVDPSVYIDAYNLILECSQAHSPRSFAIKLLDLMSKMCSYDEAMVFFLDVNKKISVDRTRNEFFSKIEQDRLNLALPILNNMYRNFFYQGTDFNPHENQSGWSKYNFTKRETEIVNLLCQGMSIQNISSALYISKNTTYKHIAHIYEKAHVSTQQELLFKIMSQTEN